jgi:hypothetical protein
MDSTTGRIFRLVTTEVAIDHLLDVDRDLLATDFLGAHGPYPKLALAMEYLAAARLLLDSRVQRGNNVYTVTHPVLFLVRHSLELYLKALLDHAPEHHDLAKLLSAVNELLMRRFGQSLDGGWLLGWVREFHEYDRTSMGFRYSSDKRASVFFPAEHEVNFDVLRRYLDVAAIVFYPFHEAVRRAERSASSSQA